MNVSREDVLAVLSRVSVAGGGDLVSRDLVRAVMVEGGQVRFVIEAATPEAARGLVTAQVAAELALKALPGVTSVQAVLTAHGPAAKSATAAPPVLQSGVKIGQHPTPHQGGPARIAGVDRIIAVGLSLIHI